MSTQQIYPAITEVLNIKDTREGNGVYELAIKVQFAEGEEPEQITFISRPTDVFGINPQIRQWMSDNPDAPITPYTPPTIDLAAYAANKRWQKEVGGCVWNEWPVMTDDRSQGKILAEVSAIERGERADPDGWKFADGEFRLVSNQDFIALALAVRNHVRNCFASEAQVLQAIAAGTITTTAEIDVAFA